MGVRVKTAAIFLALLLVPPAYIGAGAWAAAELDPYIGLTVFLAPLWIAWAWWGASLWGREHPRSPP